MTGNIDKTQKSKLLDTIYNLFKKLIESKICLDTIFEISVTTNMRLEKREERKYTLKDVKNRNLLMDLKVLFEYFKENVTTNKEKVKKKEISENGVIFESSRLGIVIIGNNIKNVNDNVYSAGKNMLFITSKTTRK